MGTSRGTGLCWWCHIELPPEGSPYRGTDPIIAPPAGVVVCTPACPERPEGERVWRRGDEISAEMIIGLRDGGGTVMLDEVEQLGLAL